MRRYADPREKYLKAYKKESYLVNRGRVRVYTQNLSQQLIELAEIKPGQRVLDVATGIGEPSITVAKVIGTGGHVLATDISRQMLAVAKERATFLRLLEIIECAR